ncbi:hypothetical protein Q4F19_15650 [Sphingomonas sp. BIUV-7]|uniref:dTDP-4-dehydrorhamnose reductase n=1 Tax=Sphingomonas natans TaxID=3063330 RepID=A0ABT8YBX1_9SPHN|nr:family 1 glycosylhydrolase [Sphingomonas sp. BIUV-7]MDO6415826.1 hypothetical protein [Sphingomonas sp. BIUV-7]
MSDLELWGGPECTINRVGPRYGDQVRESGHDVRLSDLDRFAELGLSAIRYPVLWESVAPDDPACMDWRWADERLARLRALELRPIVGLVHHGSGPRRTDLLADSFAPGLGDYAGAVARRFPWIDEYTPVNEPVTTARFSALYGHWYPHQRDERAFWRALLNQIDGTRLAMRAIRIVNSDAKLLQTDDLGRTYATAAVRDQAAFDNVRRWMSWDLLCGRVVPGHALWARLCGYGFEPRLRAIADDPCPPDTIGVNHYLTSDRFLDHRVQRYPERSRGGSGDRPYADTEAVRVLQPPPAGLEGVLREAWRRYGIPLAVTEIHNGCTREEQMRWMAQGWDTARRLRDEDVDVRAVTAWSLIGSYGWDTLLTRPGRYEPGVYEIVDGQLRPTALVELLKRLPRDATLPAAATGHGWWQRDIRFQHRPIPRPAPFRAFGRAAARVAPDILLIAGVDEAIGVELARCCHERGLACHFEEAGSLRDAAPWGAICSEASLFRVSRAWGVHEVPVLACVPGLDAAAIHRLLDRLIDLASPAQVNAAA